jgi:drug/metabolite transporter (DMT)-like permease
MAACGASYCTVFPARSITRLSWPLRMLVGAALGPLALLVIFVLLRHGHLEISGTFRGSGWLWAYSILVSTVSFVLYVFLLRKEKVVEHTY